MRGLGLPRWILAGALVGLVGCREASEPAAPPVPHYAAWDALVKAAWRGDVEALGTYTAAMHSGPLPHGTTDEAAEAEAALGGALGFLRVARDPEERATGIVRLAGACARCHRAEHAQAPPRPEWSHHHAAAWAVDAVVWSRSGDPSDAEIPDPVRAAVGPPGDDIGARAKRVLIACAVCHALQPESLRDAGR